MTVDEFDIALTELETRIDRLRALYENWFRGYEKSEPNVPRKDVERRVYALRKELPRNTALRFRYHQMYLKFTTLTNYWQRTARQIEEGTYKPQLLRLKRKNDREQEMLERRERRRLERGEEKREDGARGFELDLDESLDVDDLLDALEMDELASAIERPGPHSEPPPPTTVHQRLPEGPATATFGRLKESLPKPPAPPAQPAADAPLRATFQPNAPFQPNAAGTNGAGRLAPAAPASTTFGRPSTAASYGAAPPPRPAGASAAPADRPGPPLPAPTTGAARPFVPNAPGAQALPPAGSVAKPPPPAPSAPGTVPVRPATTTIGRPAPVSPATLAGQRPPPAMPNASNAQRPAPSGAVGTGAGSVARPAPGTTGVGRPAPPLQAGGTIVGRPPPGSPLAGSTGAPTEQRLRHIYDEYAAARRRNNEGEVRYEALVSSIQKMLPELSKKHQGKKIDFDVVVKDGRVGLKPKAT